MRTKRQQGLPLLCEECRLLFLFLALYVYTMFVYCTKGWGGNVYDMRDYPEVHVVSSG